jgi:glycosyltransferase involved in cell wall biosynthesis
VQFGLPPDAVVAVHLGRLVRWKGQAVFLRALAQARARAPRLHGLVVGGWTPEDDQPGSLGGGEPYARELHRLAAELGLAEDVRFTGFLADPGPAYAAADVVVHSSLRPEPFGRSVIEAMLAGRPVIAARAGALPEIVREGEAGYLTPPDDPAALAEALVRLAGDPALRQRLSASARLRAEAGYTLTHMARRMEDHYRLTLARR